MKRKQSISIFKIVNDGDMFRWQRQSGPTRWTSKDAWVSDIEAAASAFQVAGCGEYPGSVLSVTPALASALDVWKVVEQYAATVEVRV